MKINKIKLIKSKLLKLKLIETKVYKKKPTIFLKVVDITYRLKKALQIIYKYHVNNKRILFIGNLNDLDKNFKKIFKKTKHILFPKHIWMNGILSNQKACFDYLRKNKNSVNKNFSKTLLQLNKKLDLIVVLDSNSKENILNESYLKNIPLIFVGADLNTFDLKASYKIPGNFKFTNKQIRDNFFYLILTAIFKKANFFKDTKNKII